MNSERTLTLWQALFRHLAFVCVCLCWSPFTYSDSMVTAPRRSGSLWPGLYCSVLWSLGWPRRAQAVYGPAGATLCWNQSVCRIDVCFTQLWKPWPHAAMAKILPSGTHSFVWTQNCDSGVKRDFKSKHDCFCTLLGFTVCWLWHSFVNQFNFLIQSMQGSHDHG